MREIAKKEDWETKEMPEERDEFILNRHFSDEEIENLRYGNIPKEMEDKWFWYFENNRLYAHRSWTGNCIYIVDFDFENDTHTVTVNRDAEQYGNTDNTEDLNRLNSLLNWWVKPQYDYYNEWLEETVKAIRKTKE